MTEPHLLIRAGFFKRIAAIIYDFLVVVALAMLVTILNLLLVNGLVSFELLTLGEGVEPSAFLNKQWWFQLELLLSVWLFYAWFWYDGGQTIGMRAWRLKVESDNNSPLTLKRTALRALFALLGLGNLLVIFTPKKKLSLQDKLTQTRVVVLSKEDNKRVYLKGIEDPKQ